MLTFDEFFKKKRIDLSALKKAEPNLFSEFKTHYEQMGEKSFDHTKKYWFNKTRRQFPLAPDVKTEKPQVANPIAEQTITESLSETVAQPTAKVGFTPRFKAGVTKPSVEESPAPTTEAEKPDVQSESPVAAKPAGFVPRFKMKSKTEESISHLPVSEKTTEPASQAPLEPQPAPPGEPASKPAGFTPRFKMKPKSEDEVVGTPGAPVEPKPETSAEAPAQPAASKPAGFTPRFKMKPKDEPGESATDNPVGSAGAPKSDGEPSAATAASEAPVKKPAYKPRFVPPKPKED